MADQDGRELWELEVTVPPVTEEIHTLLVRCGRVVVQVRPVPDRGPAGWRACQDGCGVTAEREDYELAVADAREWVEAEERRRLLVDAVDQALRDGEVPYA